MDDLAYAVSRLESMADGIDRFQVSDPAINGRVKAGNDQLRNAIQTFTDVLEGKPLADNHGNDRGVDLAREARTTARKPERGPVDGNSLVGHDKPA